MAYALANVVEQGNRLTSQPSSISISALCSPPQAALASPLMPHSPVLQFSASPMQLCLILLSPLAYACAQSILGKTHCNWPCWLPLVLHVCHQTQGIWQVVSISLCFLTVVWLCCHLIFFWSVESSKWWTSVFANLNLNVMRENKDENDKVLAGELRSMAAEWNQGQTESKEILIISGSMCPFSLYCTELC